MSIFGMEPQFCACAPYLVDPCFLSLIKSHTISCLLPFSPPLLFLSSCPSLPLLSFTSCGSHSKEAVY